MGAEYLFGSGDIRVCSSDFESFPDGLRVSYWSLLRDEFLALFIFAFSCALAFWYVRAHEHNV